MKSFYFILKWQYKLQGRHKIIGSVGLAETHLFLGLMNDKIMFDRCYCINSANHCENEENIVTLYFITSSHFPIAHQYLP